MIGERGGTTRSLVEAEQLLEEHKPQWSAVIRDRIATVLVDTSHFHAADLLDLRVPAEHKNAIGAAVGSFVRQGLMEETGVRRSSGDEAGHARKSAVYRITELGRAKLLAGTTANSGDAVGVDAGGARSGQPDSGPSIPEGAAESHADAPPPRLFEAPAERKSRYSDPDQRAA